MSDVERLQELTAERDALHAQMTTRMREFTSRAQLADDEQLKAMQQQDNELRRQIDAINSTSG